MSCMHYKIEKRNKILASLLATIPNVHEMHNHAAVASTLVWTCVCVCALCSRSTSAPDVIQGS